MNAVDTNIWIYCHDSRDPIKQATAKQTMIAAQPLALLWQVGCEFIAACRKLEPFGFSRDEAWDALADMCANAKEILLPVAELWPDARSLQDRYSVSSWDALLIAACIRGYVQTLYTENMGAPRTIDSKSLVNPFLTGP
jgi:predicted nucleic acid-binding protein